MPIDNSTRFPKPLAADLRELSEGMAIVIDGDTAPKAIASGQYLFIKNHSTLATGGYHATAAIASGADITSSNVTPDADGIVNGAFSSLSEQIANVAYQDLTDSVTVGGSVSNVQYKKVYRIGKTVFVYIRCSVSGAGSTILSGLPKADVAVTDFIGANTYLSANSKVMGSNRSFTDEAICIIYHTSG